LQFRLNQNIIMPFSLKPKQICEKYGISLSYLSDLEAKGYMEGAVTRKGKAVWYDPDLVAAAMEKVVKDSQFSKIKLDTDTDSDSEEAGGMSMMEAKKVEQIYKAKLAQLKFEMQSGKLVEKQAVYRELFGIGKSIRDALVSVPDRCIDNVLAARSRREAHGVLLTEIQNALEGLTGAADKFEKAFGIENASDDE
jgi:phage terminase Nu1 subunit (DNA packaging protein)